MGRVGLVGDARGCVARWGGGGGRYEVVEVVWSRNGQRWRRGGGDVNEEEPSDGRSSSIYIYIFI